MIGDTLVQRDDSITARCRPPLCSRRHDSHPLPPPVCWSQAHLCCMMRPALTCWAIAFSRARSVTDLMVPSSRTHVLRRCRYDPPPLQLGSLQGCTEAVQLFS